MTTSVPSVTRTKSYAAMEKGGALAPFTLERRELRSNDVALDIKFCGICHSDIHQVRDEWGGSIFPMVPGHEIAGIVTAVGDAVKTFAIGDRVGVGCFVDSQAEGDARKTEQYDGKMTGTYNAKDADGQPTYGGYAERIVVDADYVLRLPEALGLDVAAPLLCAGITLYSPLKHWGAGPGKRVAIVGMGGLGHMGVQIAHAMGAHVTVLSQSLSKEDDGKKLGADEYYATAERATFKKLAGSFDLIVNTVSAPIDWNAYLGMLKTDGTFVVLGVPERPIPVNAFALISGRRSIAGSMIGSIEETQEMLDFCAAHDIKPWIETIGFDKVNEAYDRVVKSDVRYRFVLDTSTL